mgnify:CR=1 FL=1
MSAASTMTATGLVARERDSLRPIDGKGGLVATGLGKRYRKRPVVRNVSISLRRGEAVGLLGPNGAGKTTTFYMITGLVQPDEGQVVMDGNDVTHLPMYRRWRSPAASGGAARSPGRWPRTLPTSSSMNLWPASIRSRWARSAIWCAT